MTTLRLCKTVFGLSLNVAKTTSLFQSSIKNPSLISSSHILKKYLSNDVSSNTTTQTTDSNKPIDLKSVQDYEKATQNEFDEPESKKASNSKDNKEAKTKDKSKVNDALHPFSVANANRSRYFGWQPTAETHSSLMFDGVPYNKLNIVHIMASKNNTILTLTDAAGVSLYTTSAGACGFKNSKKSTAIAGQAAGIAMSDHIKRRAIKNLRVVVKGFGNGRLPSIKALQMSKLQIVSVTDTTPIPIAFAKPARPPVKRRI